MRYFAHSATNQRRSDAKSVLLKRFVTEFLYHFPSQIQMIGNQIILIDVEMLQEEKPLSGNNNGILDLIGR